METPRIVSDARHIHWSGLTNAGHVRPNNEDSFIGLQFNAQEVHYLGKVGDATIGNTDFVFAVSDGMGGAKAGEFASRITVDKIMHLLPRSFKQGALGMDAGFEDIFDELYDQIHRALVFVGDSDEDIHGMQATLSLCWFTPGWMYFAHIGDSRIYYLPAAGKEIKQLSQDDTFVGWLFRTGQISEREARHHPRRTALQKALGGGNQFVDPQGRRRRLRTGRHVSPLHRRPRRRPLRQPDARHAPPTGRPRSQRQSSAASRRRLTGTGGARQYDLRRYRDAMIA